MGLGCGLFVGEQGQDPDEDEESGQDGGKAVEQEAEAQQPEGEPSLSKTKVPMARMATILGLIAIPEVRRVMGYSSAHAGRYSLVLPTGHAAH